MKSRAVLVSVILVGVCILVSVVVSVKAGSGSDIAVREVLQRTARVYATCNSYRDTGTAKEDSFSLAQILFPELPVYFSTVFVRPNHFRFHYSECNDSIPTEYVTVWMSGSKVESRDGGRRSTPRNTMR
jgi:hypothetical protein